jgi:hypothetical protein
MTDMTAIACCSFSSFVLFSLSPFLLVSLLISQLFGEMDQWYVDCKELLALGMKFKTLPLSQQQEEVTVRDLRNRLATVAKDVVSFHYVSEAESRLLYALLDKVRIAHLGPDCDKSVPSAKEIYRLWPRGNITVVGDYAQALKSAKEADVLRRFLNEVHVL